MEESRIAGSDAAASSEQSIVVEENGCRHKGEKNGKGHRRPSLTTEMPPQKKHKSSEVSDVRLKERLEEARAQVRAEFEKNKNATLAAYPPQLKEMFGEIGFTKWSTKMYACIILNPYDVAPGEVRRAFYESFKKLKRKGKLDDLEYLVYFYGEENINAQYSFIAKNKFIPYEDGVQKKLLLPFLAARKKLEQNKKLTKADERSLRVLKEMEEDMPKAKCDRHSIPFPEEYDLLSETDLLDDESESDDSESDSESASEPFASRKQQPVVDQAINKVPKKKKKKPMKDTPQCMTSANKANTPKERVVVVTTQSDAADVEGDADDEDEANLQYALGDSDNEDAPDSESDDGWREPKVERGDDDLHHRDIPEPQSKKGKGKDTEKRRDSRKSEVTPLEMERRDFRRCEKMYRPLIHEWEKAIRQPDLVALERCFEQASAVVGDCSAPFLEAYFADLVKRTKALLRDSTELGSQGLFSSIKGIGKTLKELYNEKKDRVPHGFKTPKMKPFQDLSSDKLLVGTIQRHGIGERDKETESHKSTRPSDHRQEPSRVAKSFSPDQSSRDDSSVALTRNRLSLPIEVLSSSDNLEEITAPKADRHAFSLVKLKTRADPPSLASAAVVAAVAAATDTAAPSTQAESSASSLLPVWLTTPFTGAPFLDGDRALAFEFLIDMANHSLDQTVLADAVAHAIEEAIYDWAARTGGSSSAIKIPDEHSQSEVAANNDPSPSVEPWIDLYWNRVHDVVAAVAGVNGNGTGTLAPLILNGEFPTAESLISLSDEQLKKAFN